VAQQAADTLNAAFTHRRGRPPTVVQNCGMGGRWIASTLLCGVLRHRGNPVLQYLLNCSTELPGP
jgi:hypothetical protein